MPKTKNQKKSRSRVIRRQRLGSPLIFVVIAVFVVAGFYLIFQVLASLPPPQPSSPNPDQISSSNPIFYWTPVAGAASYRLQVAKNADRKFGRPLLNVPVASTVFRDPGFFLKNGTYRWRVRVMKNSSGQYSPWSQPLTFTATDSPPPPP